eukprot:TRINITY_DN5836_c0_g2_i1.p1 TRINITY_DN5836_c0_g2~~TRINITY_DN5836_c0_g2_i1.p1  ORF type:complete len:877 (+),score=256.69 TRINITY_DN5836_c0_g2_i1:72-2702(+)
MAHHFTGAESPPPLPIPPSGEQAEEASPPRPRRSSHGGADQQGEVVQLRATVCACRAVIAALERELAESREAREEALTLVCAARAYETEAMRVEHASELVEALSASAAYAGMGADALARAQGLAATSGAAAAEPQGDGGAQHREQLAALQGDLCAAQAQRDDALGRLGALEQDHRRLAEALAAGEQERVELQQQLSAAREQLAAAPGPETAARVEAAEAAALRQRDRADSAATAAADSAVQVRVQRRRADSAAQDLERLRDGQRAAEARCAEAERLRDEAALHAQELERRLAEARAAASEAEAREQAAQQQAAEHLASQQRLTEAAAELERQLQHARTDMDQQLNALRREVTAARDDAAQQRLLRDEAAARADRAAQDAERAARLLAEEQARAAQRVRELEQDAAAAKRTLADREAGPPPGGAANGDLRLQITDLQRQLAAAQQEARDAKAALGPDRDQQHQQHLRELQRAHSVVEPLKQRVAELERLLHQANARSREDDARKAAEAMRRVESPARLAASASVAPPRSLAAGPPGAGAQPPRATRELELSMARRRESDESASRPRSAGPSRPTGLAPTKLDVDSNERYRPLSSEQRQQRRDESPMLSRDTPRAAAALGSISPRVGSQPSTVGARGYQPSSASRLVSPLDSQLQGRRHAADQAPASSSTIAALRGHDLGRAAAPAAARWDRPTPDPLHGDAAAFQHIAQTAAEHKREQEQRANRSARDFDTVLGRRGAWTAAPVSPRTGTAGLSLSGTAGRAGCGATGQSPTPPRPGSGTTPRGLQRTSPGPTWGTASTHHTSAAQPPPHASRQVSPRRGGDTGRLEPRLGDGRLPPAGGTPRSGALRAYAERTQPSASALLHSPAVPSGRFPPGLG